jgi:putative acetyltransferase
MSANVIIRIRNESDAAVLAEIFRRSVREVASRDYHPAQIEAWVRVADEHAAWSERVSARQVWVAESGGQVVGFIQLDPPDHIDLTYVHPGHQRQGVATALLAAVEAAARVNGVKVLHVEASITSRPFFAVHGFEVVTPQYVTVGGQEFLNYRMTKHLV